MRKPNSNHVSRLRFYCRLQCIITIVILLEAAVCIYGCGLPGGGAGLYDFAGQLSEGNDYVAIELSDVQLRAAESEQENCYYYNTLNTGDKTLYLSLYVTLREVLSGVDIGVWDDRKITYIHQLVIYDHPELFYAEGFSYKVFSENGITTRVVFYVDYSYSREEVDRLRKEVEKAASSWVKEADERARRDLPEYSYLGESAIVYLQLRSLYEIECERTQYVSNAPQSQSITSVFLNGKSVCGGYAKAYQYLCRRLGIECSFVSGKAGGGEHAWCLVKAGDEYYYTDPTWGEMELEREELQEDSLYNYDYLLVTGKDISYTHKADVSLPLPTCDSRRLNYYIAEKCMVPSGDTSVASFVISEGEYGRPIYLRFEGKKEYEEFLMQLKQGAVYALTNRGMAYYYCTNEQLFTVAIW